MKEAPIHTASTLTTIISRINPPCSHLTQMHQAQSIPRKIVRHGHLC